MSNRRTVVSFNQQLTRTAKRLAGTCKVVGVYALVALLTVGTLPAHVWAANGTWTQTAAGDHIWDNGANWSGAIIPGSAVGDIATFTQNLFVGSQTVDLTGSNLTLGQLQVTGSNTAATLRLVGGTLSMNNGASGALIILTSTNAPTAASSGNLIGADIAMTGSSALIINGGNGHWGLSGDIVTNGSQLSLSNTANTMYVSGDITGSSRLLKNGNGTVVLSGNNTQAGTTITQGVLGIRKAGSLGTGPVTMSGGTLRGEGALALNNDIRLQGNVTFGGTTTGGLEFNGILNFGGAARQTTISADSLLNTTIANATGWTKAGGSILYNRAVQNYNGDTTITGGVLSVQGAGTLGLDVAGNDVFVNAGSALRLEGPGNFGSNQILTLNATGTNTGPIIAFGSGFNNGAATIGFSNAGTGLGNIRVTNTTNPVVVALDGAFNFTNDVFASTTGSALYYLGATLNDGAFTGNTLTAVGGAYSFGGGAPGRSENTLTIANANVLTGANQVIVGSYDNISRNLGISLFLNTAQNNTGGFLVGNAGNLVVGTGAALGSNTVTLNGGTLDLRSDGYQSDNTSYNGVDLLITNSSSTLNIGTLRGGAQNNVHLDTVTFGSSNRTLTLNSNTSNYGLFVDGGTTITGSNTISTAGLYSTAGVFQTNATDQLFKAGSGVLRITGSSNLSGTTTLANGTGTLATSHTNGLTTGQVLLGGNTTLDLRQDATNTNIVFQVGGLNFTSTNATINVAPLTSAGSNAVVEIAAPVSFTFANTNNVALNVTANPSYLGGAVTAADILAGGFNSGSSYSLLISGDVTVTGTAGSGRNLTINPTSSPLEISGSIIETGGVVNLIKGGGGVLFLSGSNAYTGATTVTSGDLIIANANALGTTSAININNGGDSSFLLRAGTTLAKNITVNSTNGNVWLGSFGTTGNTFSGNIALNGTNRQYGLISIDGGNTSFSGDITAANGAGINKIGGGNVILSGNNTLNSTNTISQGNLIVYGRTVGQSLGGNVVMNGGSLVLTGIAADTTTTLTGLTVVGGSRLNISGTGGGNSTALHVNGSLNRTIPGTLRVVAENGNFGTSEVISFTAAPGFAGGTNILGPWLVVDNGNTGAGDYVTVDGSNVLQVATYGSSGDIATVTQGATQVANVNVAGSTSGDVELYAAKISANTLLDGDTLFLGGGFSNTNQAAGLILNSANITSTNGGAVSSRNAELVVYSSGNSSIDAGISARAGFTKFGPGNLTLNANIDSINGSINISGGTLTTGVSGVFSISSSNGTLLGNAVNIEADRGLDLGATTQEIGLLNGEGTLNIASGGVLMLGRGSGSGTYSGQITGSGTLIKVGGATQYLDNISRRVTTGANQLSNVILDNGSLVVHSRNDNAGAPYESFRAVPSDVNYTMKFGTLFLRDNGDNTAAVENILLGNSFNVTHTSALNVDRIGGGVNAGTGSNKQLLGNNLNLAAGSRLTTAGGSGYGVGFLGSLNLAGNAVIDAGANTTFYGSVNDGGNGYTLNKGGASNLVFSGTSHNWSGGLVVTGGNLLFGNFVGSTFFANGGQAGSGDIIMEPGTMIRVNSASNIAAGQKLYVYGNDGLANTGSTQDSGLNSRLEMLFDGNVESINLHSYGSSTLAVNLNSNLGTTNATGFMSTAIDLGMIGNGKWNLGAVGSTIYDADTLGAGAGNAYRFGSTQNVTLAINKANVVTGDNGVIIGQALRSFDGGVANNSQGIVRFAADQNYTGQTVVHRGVTVSTTQGNVLDVRGLLSTSAITSWGDLRLIGGGALANTDGSARQALNMMPGSQLQLDYNLTVVGFNQPNMSATGLTNKLADNQQLFLNGTWLDFVNASGQVTTETIGGLRVALGSDISLRGNGSTILYVDGGLVRDNLATLALRTSAANGLGSVSGTNGRLIFSQGNAPARMSGVGVNMIAPWIINATDRTFVDYDPAGVQGFTNVAFNATNIATATTNDVVSVGDANSTLTSNVFATGLRIQGTNSQTITTDVSASTLHILSGGLIIGSNTNATISTAGLYFGDGTTAREADIWTFNGGSTTINALVTANGLVKSGQSTLVLNHTNNAISGTIQLNNGALQTNEITSLGSANRIILGGSSATLYNNNDSAPRLLLRTSTNSGGVSTFAGGLEVGAGVAYAQVNLAPVTTGSNGQVSFGGSSTLYANTLAAQQLNVSSANGWKLRLNNLNIVGTGDVMINTATNLNDLVITDGIVTSAAGSNLIKTGAGELNLGGDSSASMLGALTLNNGTLTGRVAGAFGGGELVINNGTLISRNNSSLTFFAGTNMRLTGTSAIRVERASGTGNPAHTFGNGNGTLSLDGRSHGIFLFDNNTSSTAAIWRWLGGVDNVGVSTIDIRNGSVQWQGPLSGNGTLNKTGGQVLWLTNTSSATNSFTGDLWVNQGLLRVSNTNAANRIVNGDGSIYVNPGAMLSVAHTNSALNAGATATAIERFYSTSSAPAQLGFAFAITDTAANLVLGTPASPAQNGGVIGIDVNQGNALNMANIGGGYFYLGSTVGATYSNNNLLAGVNPITGSNNVYRLGGLATLTISGSNALRDRTGAGETGTNSIVVIGKGNGWGMTGQVTLTSTGSYTGGTIVSRARDVNGGFANVTLDVNNNRRALGTGLINVYGTLHMEGAAGSLVLASNTNNNYAAVNLNPGSQLILSNTTASTIAGGRWGETTAMHLDGARLTLNGANSNAATNNETIGALIAGRGADLNLVRAGGNWIGLTTASITQTNNGTLTIGHGGVSSTNMLGNLGLNATTTSDRVIVTGSVPTTTHASNMLAPWIVSRTDRQWLINVGATPAADIYGTSRVGLAALTAVTGASLSSTNNVFPTNYVQNTTTNITLGTNDGTQILETAVATNQTLAQQDLDVYALRVNTNILKSGDNQFDDIKIRGQGFINYGGGIRIDPNVTFSGLDGTGLADGYIFTEGGDVRFAGLLNAANLIKFGNSSVTVAMDQAQFSGNWYVNQGSLIAAAFNAFGSGNVVLQGGSTASQSNSPLLQFAMDTQTTDLVDVMSGTIVAYDQNRIQYTGAGGADRRIQLGDLELRSSNPGSNSSAISGIQNNIQFVINSQARNFMGLDNVTLFDDYVVSVDAFGSYGGSNTVGFNSLTGNGFNLLKIGDGRLQLGNSANWTNGTITVDQGTLVVTHNGSLGAASSSAIIDQGGVLQINVANFQEIANLVRRDGSIERWSVDGARTGTVNLESGVSLQIDANQTGNVTINLNGGTIQGFLASDAQETLVYRTLGSGVTINLLDDSQVGILHPIQTAMYDVGKFNIDSNYATSTILQGAILEIKGNITGPGNLIKVGSDIVELSGTSNSYGNTIVTDGVLRAGVNNALPTGNLLMTSNIGMFDLNGFDVTVGNIAGDGGSIYNSAAANTEDSIVGRLLLNGSDTQTYGGTLAGNVTLVRQGSGETILSSTNSHRGNNTLLSGKLTVGFDAALGDATRADVWFNGGTLRITDSFTLGSGRDAILQGLGGTIEVDATRIFSLNPMQLTGTGNLTKTGAGTLTMLGNEAYSGNTFINDGVLSISTTNGLGTGSTVTFGGAGNGVLEVTGTSNIVLPQGLVFSSNGTLDVVDAANNVTVQSLAGAGTFIKAGAGIATVTGSNAFTGNTQINSGILSISESYNLGAGPSSIVFNGGSLQVTGTSNPDFGQTLDVTNTNGSVNVIDVANNATFAGLAGGNGLTKVGLGTLTLDTASPSFTGVLNVNAGTAAVTHSNALGSGSAVINNTATLALVGIGSFANNISTGSGANANLDVVGGNVSYTGILTSVAGSNLDIQTNGNILNITGGNIAGAGTIGIEGGSTVLVNNPGTNALTGTINVYGTLGGNGDLSNAAVVVQAGGTISPGNSIGTMYVDSLTLVGTSGNNAKWAVEVANGLSPEYNGAYPFNLDNKLADIIHVDGLLDLSGAFDELDITGLNSVPFGDYPFIIASYGSLLGTFDTVLGLIPTYYVDYNYKGLNLIAIVPEPGTLALFGLAAAALLRRRNNR